MNWDTLKGVSLDQQAVENIGKSDISIPISWYIIGVIVLVVVAFVVVSKTKKDESGKNSQQSDKK